MRAVYLASPYFLGREVLGYTKFCETQLEWSEYATTLFNPRAPKRTWSLVLSPRETLKSTYWTVTYAIWLLLNNPDLTILIVSETITNAEAFLREIRAKLQSEQFVKVFGNIVNKNLNRADALDLTTRKNHSKEANLEAAGLGKAITGRHYDVVIADDIAGVQDRDSEAKRAVTMAFLSDIVDVLKKECGFLQIIGTRWHREDIYAHIKDKLAPDMERKALGKFNIWERPAHAPDGSLNFPRLLPEARLQELKTVKQGKDGIDITTFMAQYELLPLDPATQIFKTLHFADHKGLKYSKLSQWTDPAMKVEKDADFSAIVVIGKIAEGEHHGKEMVLYASLDKRSPTKVVADHNRIYRMVREQNPDVEYQVAMEENGFQGLKDFAKAMSLQDSGEGVPTRGIANTENKDCRIKSLEPAVTGGFVLFREDWADAPENYKILIEQIRNYPQSKKDGPDALQGARKRLNKSGAQIR